MKGKIRISLALERMIAASNKLLPDLNYALAFCIDKNKLMDPHVKEK